MTNKVESKSRSRLVDFLLILLINVATLLICVFVLIAPSYLISHIHPAKSMRYE